MLSDILRKKINGETEDEWSELTLEENDLRKKIDYYNRILEGDPKNVKAWNNKGLALTKLGRYNEAIECYNRALEIDPESGDAWFKKGLTLTKLGRYNEAIECYNRALEIDPENTYVWIGKGVTLTKLGRYNEAIECYNRALEIDPKNPTTWYNKGVTLHKLGRYEEAIKCLNESLNIKDDLQVRKIKEWIEMKLKLKKKPRLKIKLLSTSLFTLNVWEKVEMEVINEGDTVARDVSFQFSDDVTVRNLPEVEVKPKDKKIVEFYIKPKVLGDVPVEVEVKYRDYLYREYRFRETVTIEVRETLDKKTLEKNTSSVKSVPKTFPPELLEKYEEVEFIGKGGFTRVFKAKRKKDGNEVAVKVLTSLDEPTGRSFIRELSNWTRLNHKNIVKIYDYNITPIPYLEMELCDQTLADLEKPLDPDRVGWIIFNVAEGLKYAHAQKIIHRDLKPQNILLKDGIPKISDWGLSKVIAESTSATTTTAFTPYYASPEQIDGKNIDERTDIWQLGVIFYELVTGDLPFKGDSFIQIGMAIATKEPVKPSKINPEAEEVEGIIMKCLQKDMAKRYRSVKDLQRDLARFLRVKYRKSLRSSARKRDFTRSAYYCSELLLINMKINNMISAYKYALDLLNYADGDIKEQVQELCKQLKARIKYKIKDIPEELIQKAEVIAHRVRVGS